MGKKPRDIGKYLIRRDVFADLSRELVANTTEIGALHYYESGDEEFIKIIYTDGGYEWYEIELKGLVRVKTDEVVRELERTQDWEVGI